MTSHVQTVTTLLALRGQVAPWKAEKQTIAFVPTMGALHAGHLSLVKQAQKTCDKVVVSIFVNPKQFGVDEDLSDYPRPLDEDKAKLSDLKTDLLYLPSSQEMYTSGFSTSIHIDGITDHLCGKSRPTHFDGVALIVTKLLLQVLPDKALFGEKDFQQLMVIKKLVNELNIPVEIDSVPIFREQDGLAMSSRNVYLSKAHRDSAPQLYQIMQTVIKQFSQNRTGSEKAIETILNTAKDSLAGQGFKVDYFDLRYEDTLEQVADLDYERPARLFAAIFVGKTRLIDNIALIL